MTESIRLALVIARRDFLSIVATPTFLLFLLAPVFMLGFGVVGGMGAQGLEKSAADRAEIIAIVAPGDRASLQSTDERMRATFTDAGEPPPLRLIAPDGTGAAQAKRVATGTKIDVYAVMFGPLATPTILERNTGAQSGRYLASLADGTLREQRTGPIAKLAEPQFGTLGSGATRNKAQQGVGFAAVFVIFILTLMLAGQAVGTLAEEKGNKVIEILAAAAPLEAVFSGKLLAMLGVALLFVSFWFAVALGGGTLAATMFADTMAGSGSPAAIGDFAPAIGFPLFVGLGVIYFVMAFLLLGAVFLGIGALASTMREIQMLSLPITIFQVAMFGFASAAANDPGSTLALAAQIVPFSSPFAMAARGATDPTLWPHLAALAWQALWVAVVVRLSVAMFRKGVLKSGPAMRFGRRRTRGAA